MRIIASIGTLLAVALACATPVRAQDFPSKPIKLIVPHAAGGGTDIVARIVAQKLQDKWGPAVIVENRAGPAAMSARRPCSPRRPMATRFCSPRRGRWW